jgi:hypothetical protein
MSRDDAILVRRAKVLVVQSLFGRSRVVACVDSYITVVLFWCRGSKGRRSDHLRDDCGDCFRLRSCDCGVEATALPTFSASKYCTCIHHPDSRDAVRDLQAWAEQSSAKPPKKRKQHFSNADQVAPVLIEPDKFAHTEPSKGTAKEEENATQLVSNKRLSIQVASSHKTPRVHTFDPLARVGGHTAWL